MEQSLPLPGFNSQNVSHSFKNLNRTNSNKKPPKLYAKDVSFCRFQNYDSLVAQPICFKKQTKLADIYRHDLPESYFQQCFDNVSKIGEGSFGEVFKVRSKEDGLYYAVKKSKEYYRSEGYRKQRLEEVKRYEEFSDHGHCVTLYRAWEQDYQLYMQMELCHGSLESYVMEKKHIPETKVWSFLLDLLLALKSLHDRNLIHLDVKMDNILITDDEVCKLGDFGLMIDLDRDYEKAMEGDSKYMAPEELEGKFTKAADIFSLGITILELSCNLELPANGILWQQLRSGVFPQEITCLISPELFHVIKSMMSPNLIDRPSVDSLLKNPVLSSILQKRRKWQMVKNVKQFQKSSIEFFKRNLDRITHWILSIFLSVASFFSLTHVKEKPQEENNANTESPGLKMDLLNKLNNIKASTDSPEGGNIFNLTDGPRKIQKESPTMYDFADNLDPAQIALNNMYSSTPISHGVSMRRLRFLTPQTPETNGFNRSLKTTSDQVSSFTCKKLFDQSDDSDSD